MYQFDHQPQYPVDLIAQRDEKLKISSSVIKSWNVRFVDADTDGSDYCEPPVDEPGVTAAEPEAELTPEQEEAIRNANEIFARLEAEKAADEANYNAATNSYSGAYGTGPISEDTAAQAASILAEKKDAFTDMLSELQNS